MTGAPIFIALAVVDALVLALLIRTGGRWFTNVAAILVALLFNFIVWYSLGTYQGWPARIGLPKNAIFITAIIDEPSIVNNDPGHIDLWLVPAQSGSRLLGYKPSQDEPRAYREKFSIPLEQAVQSAVGMQKRANGAPVAITTAKRRGTGKPSRGHNAIPPSAFRPYILPPVGSSLKGN